MALLLCAALCAASIPVYASNAQIQDSKQKIEDNKEKLSEVQSEKAKVEAKLSELSALKSDAAAYIQKLDAELADLENQIGALSTQMTEKNAQIETTKQELSAAEEEEARQYASMKLRIKYMYENGSTNYIDLLLESKSLSDMLNRAEYIQKVSEYDRQKLDEFEAIRQSIADTKQRLEGEYAELEGLKSQTQAKQASVETLQADKQKELAGYNARISEANADIAEMQSNIAGIQAAIKAEENRIASIEAEMRRQEEEARKKAEEAGKSYEVKNIGNISFTWPCPSSGRITSGFGGRSSPTEGASTNHQGIDIGASSGASVIAAAGGTVVISTYSASAGNYIMINHGGGVYTVYMHMNSRAVSEGQSVSKGQQIGTVGSTGYSTGPHLHFGIRTGGRYVNPTAYVSP
ncbi:MAG: peptidoglycan DD-metalloendopeptidase family protein [Eubacteriales bacterium]|nr:peptidoglycan DD-metalloendopeptidase family protein [Eubacteriales bacterium]